MKLSQYNMIVQEKDAAIIFNSMRHTCVIIDKEAYDKFLSLSKDERYDEYVRLGMYIEDAIDESQLFRYYSRKLTETRKDAFFRILTTTACNARCFYCYEKGIKSMDMDVDTADRVVEFICKHSVNGEHIGIEWFGGEPLVNSAIIDHICGKLNQIGKKFVSKMISNGYLFDRAMVERATKLWHLGYVQITLDGLKETYEKVKRYNAENAFERVTNNIDLLLEHEIDVNIRLNYDTYNFEEMFRLIDYLSGKYAGNKRVFVSARRIIYDDRNNDMITTEETDCRMIGALLRADLSTDILSRLRPRYYVCSAYLLNHFVIMPNGDIYKCSKDVSAPESKVGDIYSGIHESSECQWCSPDLPKKCLSCELLPLCNGGCRFEALNRRKECMMSKEYVNQILRIYLEKHLQNKTQ